MKTPIAGLHHVTAIASDPQRNLDFYTQLLGLRFVKRTINFDDPGTYHFYFGDDTGKPGTILTFFPWPGARKGQMGAGEVIATAFSIPVGSIEFWLDRLKANGVDVQEHSRFGSNFISFSDPDGMVLELVEQEEAHPGTAPRYSDVEGSKAIQGFYGVTLLERSLENTEELLGIMGLGKIAQEDNAQKGRLVRFAPEGDALGRFVDIKLDAEVRPGRMGAGTVHHIAFRNTDDAAQAEWRRTLARYLPVTPVQDRTYFHSIYFREPGGVLFEMATDNPGFLIDEPVESLGEELRIPEWFEPNRRAIEARVLPITLHKAAFAKEETANAQVAGVSR
ncbi:MAG: ring-cleaving dioxygenase [Acidobacteriaceae bacterium]|nr:ring-cleaving dioxygenase [Acidobacteriaceae bacterium]